MTENKEMKLVLENGMEFVGAGFGASNAVVGEIVFNTSMVGYQEIASDPSYAGQIVVMTYPLMGQYGITDDDFETRSLSLSGLVVRECCGTPSNFRYTKTMAEDFDDRKITGISGLDTRMITRIIRKEGSMKAAIVDAGTSTGEALALIRSSKDEAKPVQKVSCAKRWFSRTPQHNFDVVVIDCGIKHSVISALNRRGCNVTVVPFNSTAEEILAFNPDGVLVSNGPGNPAELTEIVEVISQLRGKVPVYGICLGQNLIALSYGAKNVKLKFGHHGGHPVRNLKSGRIITTEHNHGYAVDEASLNGTGLEVVWRDVTDGTVEGIECGADKVCAVQFYPEGAPGPQESDFFDRFVKTMEE